MSLSLYQQQMMMAQVPAVGGGSSLPLYDTFTDADGVYVSAHIPDTGGPWIKAGPGGTADAIISGNQIIAGRSETLGQYINGSMNYVASTETNIYMSMVVNSEANNRMLIVRLTDMNNFLGVQIGNGGNVFISEWVNGLYFGRVATFQNRPAPYTIEAQYFNGVVKAKISSISGSQTATYTDTNQGVSLGPAIIVGQADNVIIQVSDGTQL